MGSCLLEVRDLKTRFQTERGTVTAVDGVSFHLNRGEVLAIVGESGCGKSVTAHSILRLYEEKGATRYEGRIEFKGRNLLELPEHEMRSIRGNRISMIFQDPLSSLNPVYTIGDQLMEPLRLHQNMPKKEARGKAVELLALTGIPSPEKRMDQYPHELSGGMRQRVMIAMALACLPEVLIADEPTTALDVTVQSQILALMDEIQRQTDMGIIMITHDLGVVAQHCHRVAVMYLGEVVEEADVRTLFRRPLHPYTRGLMKSLPQMNTDRFTRLHAIKGAVPSLHDVPKGCRFAPRCPYADGQCLQHRPAFELAGDGDRNGDGVGDGGSGARKESGVHKVRCWHYDKIAQAEGEGHGV